MGIVSSLDLLVELEAPRCPVPRPLDARARLCDWPRAPRVLLPRSSIDVAVDHEEESPGEKRDTEVEVGSLWCARYGESIADDSLAIVVDARAMERRL